MPPQQNSGAIFCCGRTPAGPLAMGINTDCRIHRGPLDRPTPTRRTSRYLVSAVDFVLCICAFCCRLSFYKQYREAADELLPEMVAALLWRSSLC